MKVIHFIPSFDTGGAEAVMTTLIEGYPGDVESGIVTFRSSAESRYLLRILKKDVFRHFRFLFCVLKMKPDVVHAHMSPTFPYLRLLRFFNRRIRMVYTVHSEYRKPSGFLLRKLNQWVFERRAVSVVFVSHFVEKSVARCWKVQGKVIYNGVFSESNKAGSIPVDMQCASLRKFVTVARLVPIKNLMLMVSAFSRIAKDDACLFIIGYDPSQEQQELAKLKAVAGSQVVFLGRKINTSDYLAGADAYCCSSLSEAMPVSVIEALALGVPVLSTPAGGIPEMITHGRHGLLSADFSEEKYVEMLRAFLSMDSNEIQSMKQHAQNQYQKSFTADRMVEQYLNVYTHD